MTLIPLRIHSQLLAILIALLEAYRRIQWNFFRLENEVSFFFYKKIMRFIYTNLYQHLNNCGQYRAIKEIPLPFVLSDADLKINSDDEERISILSKCGVTQPIDIMSNDHISISRRPSFNLNSMERNSVGHESIHRGSFYGRRDFENKQVDTTDIIGSVNTSKLATRGNSTLENVLTRIKSLRNSDNSDESEIDDDDESENDDDEDDDDDEEGGDDDDNVYFEGRSRHEEF